MYYSENPNEFRQIMLRELGFQAVEKENYTLYENPRNGFLHLYTRPGLYDFGIADYTIPRSFVVQFNTPDPFLRFGIVYEGKTRFQLERQPVSSFEASAFLVLERHLKGRQAWKPGDHFYGAEFTIYPAFLQEIAVRFPNFDPLEQFPENHTRHYLPAEIMVILQRLLLRDEEDSLNGLLLEAAILECMGVLMESERPQAQPVFSYQKDFQSIQRARDILTEQFTHPPTIEALSRMLLINSQKLKTGFSEYYHMTIGEYTASLRMSHAADLLATTEKSIAEIARDAGYGYPSNFIKKFRQTYGCTPLKYRTRRYRPDSDFHHNT